MVHGVFPEFSGYLLFFVCGSGALFVLILIVSGGFGDRGGRGGFGGRGGRGGAPGGRGAR